MSKFSEEELRAQQELLSEARNIHVALAANEERQQNLLSARAETIKSLHYAGVSWAEIARTFEVSPQAVMYASGMVKRSGKR